MEMACSYLKVLEERFYEALKQKEQWSKKLSNLCHAIRRKEHPECNYDEADSEEVKTEKSYLRVYYYNEYIDKIRDDIVEQITPEGIENDFLNEKGQYYFLVRNLLYNVRKGKDDLPEKELKKDLKAADAVIQKYVKDKGIEEELEESVPISAEKILSDEKWLKREARKEAYKMIFFPREWDVETWIELIFLKFYKEADKRKPLIKVGISKEEEKSALSNRRSWLISEGRKWFHEKGNDFTWKLTPNALAHLNELEDEERKMDLLNYVITVNKSMFSEVNWIISKGHEKKNALEREVGLKAGGFTRRLQQNELKELDPFLVCLFWKKSNVSFERFFQINPAETTIKDEMVKTAYLQKSPKVYDLVSLENMKKGTTEKDISRVYHMGALSSIYGNNYENTDAFWYSPMINKTPRQVCIELYDLKKVRVTVEYYSVTMEPLTFELPYSGVMWNMLTLDEEKALEIVNLAGHETLWDFLKYCAEMMVRKYCNTFLGISYSMFQKIKCFARIKVLIKPLILQRPDGKLQIEFIMRFRKNKGKNKMGIDQVNCLSDPLWDNEEDMRKDWQRIKWRIEAAAEDECIKWNKEAKEFSEFTMSKIDFLEYIFDEEEFITESVRENKDRIYLYL